MCLLKDGARLRRVKRRSLRVGDYVHSPVKLERREVPLGADVNALPYERERGVRQAGS